MGVSKINMNRLEQESAENARHIAVLNSEMGETRDHVKSIGKKVTNVVKEVGDIRSQVIGIKTDVAWLKRFFWIVAGSSIGGLGVGMLNLIVQK